MRPYTTNYSGRQTDVEFMQTILAPRGMTRMYLSFTRQPVKMVAGMQKLAQRFTLLLLTRLADVHFDPVAGTDFISEVLRGAGQSAGLIGATFALASTDVILQMRREDRQVDVYGTIPLDEQIASATLESFDVDYGTGTLQLHVALENAEGAAYTYVMPVTVART
jgi:hypothetical protein